MVDIEKRIIDENIILKKMSFNQNNQLLKDIFKKLNVSINDVVLKNAITVKASDKYFMFINTDSFHSNKKLRFTLAHEYAHIVLGHLSKEVDYVCQDELSSRGVDRNEIMANQLASQILMPKDVVDYLVAEKKSVREISDYLVVSEPALRYRLNKLGYVIR